MLNKQSEALFRKLILVGPAFISLLVFTTGVTDPVNTNKFLALGVVSCALLALLTFESWKLIWINHRLVAISLVLFIIFSLNSLIQSDVPVSQSLYGVYGRNNGILLYLFLTVLLFVTITVENRIVLKRVVFSIIIAGAVNVLYCGWVLIFGDFIGWSNPYGNILGTFGNPNFIGAFLGLFASVLFTAALANLKKPMYLIGILIVAGVTLVEIVKSHAIQGRVLFVLGIVINAFFFIRSRTRGSMPVVFFSTVSAIGGAIGLLGTLQIGPAAKFLYKESVSLRGEYWHAGLNMAKNHLLSGVGFDSYGDWYRTSRRISALVKPGPDTVSNASHNVLIDIFAFGGLPLFICQLLIILTVIATILREVKKSKEFDFLFVSLVGAWSCFQLQSIISINQVGLAIWGSILSGAILAYGRLNRERTRPEKVPAGGMLKTKAKPQFVSPGLRAGIGAGIGLLIAVPPFSADVKFRSAQISRDAQKVEQVLEPSYFNPQSTAKYAQVIGMFEESGLTQLAHKYALIATKFNPHSYDSWKIITMLKDSTQSEKDFALSKMKDLDPNNMNIVISSK